MSRGRAGGQVLFIRALLFSPAMRGLILLGLLLVIGSSWAIDGADVDTGDLFNSVGISFAPFDFGAYTALQCDAPAKALYAGCTGSLLDSDDLLVKLNITTGQAVLRRRLVLTSASCTRPNIAGYASSMPVDDPHLPGYIGFAYDASADNDRVDYGTTMENLGYAPCMVARNNASTSYFLVTPGGGSVFYSYRTLAIGQTGLATLTGDALLANNYALLLLDEAVPELVVADDQLIRIAPTVVNLAKESVPVFAAAGFGVAGDGDATRNGLATNGTVYGDRFRQVGELHTESVQESTINVTAGNYSLCAGDSGAPALMQDIDGHYSVYGIFTAVDAHCNASGLLTRVGTPVTMTWLGAALTAYAKGGLAASIAVRAPVKKGAAAAVSGNRASFDHVALIVILVVVLLILGFAVANTVMMCMRREAGGASTRARY